MPDTESLLQLGTLKPVLSVLGSPLALSNHSVVAGSRLIAKSVWPDAADHQTCALWAVITAHSVGPQRYSSSHRSRGSVIRTRFRPLLTGGGLITYAPEYGTARP
jgi:hypothetical protein